jgi:hypothetical protein
MKTTSLLALVALSTAALLPATAQARSGDKALAAVGGFIGGVIVGAHLDRGDRYHHQPVVVEHCPPPASVVVIDRHPRHHRHGYWQESTVRVWVPARQYVTVDRWGRRVHQYEPGHYEYRTERVWVEHRGRGRW